MKSLFFSIILITTTVAGLIINGYILVVILLTKQLKSANHILLFHLGAIDICIGLLFLAFFIPGRNGEEWFSSGTPCIFHGFLFTLLQPLALWTICGLNCDRFYIIAVPLHYSRIITSKKALISIGAVWMISILLSTPPVFADIPYTFIPRFGICEPDITSRPQLLWYSTVYAAFTLLLPATFIIICNVKIFIIARYHRHRIASAIFQVAISAQVAITHQKNPFSWSFGRMAAPPAHISAPKFHSAIYNMFQFVGSFMISYIPYYCIILMEAVLQVIEYSNSTTNVYETHLNSNFYTISSSLLLLSVPLNGFLYGVKSKPLRQVLKNYWRKKQTTHDLNQEIQARTPSTCGSRRPSFLVKPENLIDVHKMFKSPFQSQNPSSPNTLQVPSSNNQGVSIVTEDEIYFKLKTSRKNSTYKFFHDIFGGNDEIDSPPKSYIPLTCNLETKMEKSPKILLTKANSCSSITSLDTQFNVEQGSSFKPLLDNEQQSDSEKETEN